MIIKIRTKREFCLVSKRILLEIKTIYLLGIPVIRFEMSSKAPIPNGFDIVNGRLVRVNPWPSSARATRI